MTHIFIPSRAAGLAALEAFLPRAGRRYAEQRNFDHGPGNRANISLLSPYIRRRLITEHEVIAKVLARHRFVDAEKFVQEVCWRTYWKGWLEMRPSVWARYQAETKAVFSNPNLLAYYQKDYYDEMMGTQNRQIPEAQKATGMLGYQNMLRWNKMYDAAGGRVIVGGDTNGGKAPGLILHDEMEALEEAGIPRMHIIQGATEWTAEALRANDRLGSVTPGKLADILVVDADPLADIANLRKINTVMQDGRVIDRTFHASFSTPFMASSDDVDVVKDLDFTENWVKKGSTLGGGRGGANVPAEGPDPANSPQPGIETIVPVMVVQDSPTTKVMITGFNFVRRSKVLFDGRPVPYRRVSATQLEATLDNELLKRAGRFDLQVVNPEPVAAPQWGNGESNLARFLITFK